MERTSCGTGLHCPVPSLFRRISRAPSASPLAKRASPHLPWCFSAFLHPCKGRLELFESKMLPSVARSACSWPHSDILDSVEAASAHGKRVRQPKSGTTRSLTWTPRQIQVPSLVQIAGLGQRGRAHRPWHAISELGTLKPAVFPALTFSLRAAAMRLRERATAKIPDFIPFHGTSNLGNRSPIIAVGSSNLKGLCARDCQARCDKTPPNTGLTMSQQRPSGLLSLGRWTAKA